MTPQEAVLALIDSGWSESRIAREAGTSQPTIHRIKRGAMSRGPSFAVSQAVIELSLRVAQTGGVPDQRAGQHPAAVGQETSGDVAPSFPVARVA